MRMKIIEYLSGFDAYLIAVEDDALFVVSSTAFSTLTTGFSSSVSARVSPLSSSEVDVAIPFSMVIPL